jgi:hypothetical protein
VQAISPQHESGPGALETSWSAACDQVPHQEAEVERAGVDDEPLQDVRMPAQGRSPPVS